MKTYPITTQREVRAAFWENWGDVRGVSRKRMKGGDYSTDTRCAFCDYVEALCRNGDISEALASRVTLKG